MIGLMLATTAFNGERVLENTVRLVTMLVGFPLALVSVKFGIASMRQHDYARAWGSLSYGFLALVPAVGRAMSFGNPINWVTTGLYVGAMITGGLGLFYRATLSTWWSRRRDRRNRTGEER